MKQVVWYFDFISPFAYLQHESFGDLAGKVSLIYRPVLLAGLLGHWESKGPAEIPGKRTFTYQHTLWMARKAGIPMRYPPGHPFNPLKALRLSILLENRADAVREIFHYIWRDGHSLDDEAALTVLMQRLGVSDPSAISAPEVKQALKHNTSEAARQKIFGVPTFHVDGHLIWGYDATDMLHDYLADPELFNDPEMRRVEDIPVAAGRR